MKHSRSAPQRVAASLLLVAAAAHIPLIREHLEEAPYIGILFLLLSISCLALAAAILLLDAPAVWLVSGAVCLAAVVAFVASRTVGLPQMSDDIGNWTEPMGFPAVAAETLLLALAGRRLRQRAFAQDLRPGHGKAA